MSNETYYDYIDGNGEIRCRAVRYEPKDFRQCRPDGNGGWHWNMQGVKKIPYRLPELLKAWAKGRTVCVVEGEKDVETLHKIGIPGTTNIQALASGLTNCRSSSRLVQKLS